MEKQKIVLASGNLHKIKEIQQMLPDYEIIGYKQLGKDFDLFGNSRSADSYRRYNGL